MRRVLFTSTLLFGLICISLMAFSQDEVPRKRTALTRTIRLTNLHITPTQDAKVKLHLEEGDSVRIRPASVARVLKEKEITLKLIDGKGEETLISPENLNDWAAITDAQGECTIVLHAEKEVSLPEIQLFRKSKPLSVTYESGQSSIFTITTLAPPADDSVFTKKLTAFYKLQSDNQITFTTGTASDFQVLGHWADKRSISNRKEILNGGLIDIPSNSEYIFFFDQLTAQDEAGLPKELEVEINY